MTDVNDDLAIWQTDWQTPELDVDLGAPIVVLARRQRRLLIVWMAGELLVALAGLVVVGYFFVVRRDPVERLAMGALAAVCLSAGLFSWWNWRGAVRAVAETTSVCLELTERRLLAMRRGVSAGWAILAVELLVLIPWTWYRLNGQGTPTPRPAPIWPWILIVTMSALGVAAILRTGRWVRREAEIVARLRRDLNLTPPERRDRTPPPGEIPPAVKRRTARADRRRFHWRR